MTSRKKLQREAWKILNSRGPSARKGLPWYIPKVPSIISMLKRTMFLFLLTAIAWGIEIVLILGEDVFWKFNTIDIMIARAGQNLGDIFILVSIATYGLIWGFGMFYVVGAMDRWFE